MNKRNINLDLIKIIACIGVVGLHAVGMRNYTIYYLCDFSVPLFFMVNGYLLLPRENINYSYAFHKIFHILKIVFGWNLLITIPVFIFRHKIVNPLRLSMDSLLQKGYLWHFWFFGALILIYLFLPIFHRLFFLKNHSRRMACIFFMCICLCINIFSIIMGYPLHMFVPQSLRLWTWSFYFLMGGLIAAAASKIYLLPAWAHGILLLLFTFINNFSEKKIGLYLIKSRLAEYFYDDLTSIIWYILLFTFLLRLPIKEKFSAFIADISSLTMGIFIIHPILLAVLDRIYTPTGTISVLIFWAALTLVSLGITYIMSKTPVIKTFIRL